VLLTNVKPVRQDGCFDITFGSKTHAVKPVATNQSVRILGVWINLDLKPTYVFQQCKNIIQMYNKVVKFKQLTDMQLKYVYNHVIIPRIDYRSQLTIWKEHQIKKLNILARKMFKQKCALSRTTMNSIIESELDYNICNIEKLQLNRQTTRLSNQLNANGILKKVTLIRLLQ
jgi:hypothetical protein